MLGKLRVFKVKSHNICYRCQLSIEVVIRITILTLSERSDPAKSNKFISNSENF